MSTEFNFIHEPSQTPEFETFQGNLYIDGQFQAGQRGERTQRVSPAFGNVVGDYALAHGEDASLAVTAATKAFESGIWSEQQGAYRSKILLDIASAIEAELEDFALLESMETGKPLQQARDEIETSVDIWRYAVSLARNLYGDSYNTLGEQMLGLVLRQPIGVVSVITPWNFPFLILSQKLPFALAAGCTTVVKPAEITSGTTVKLANILNRVGMPKGVVNILVGAGRELGDVLVKDDRVNMVTFTGSTGVGQAVASQAAAGMKKISMELGGKNPQVIMPDCDWEAAVDAVVFGVYFNAGECCNSGSRILVHDSIADDFIAAVKAKTQSMPLGNPLGEGVKMGAIIHREHLETVLNYVTDAKRAGAKIHLGGERIEHEKGLYLQPTIVEVNDAGSAVFQDEIFGPVLTVMRFSSFDQAIQLANQSSFGLSAAIWSQNIDQCLQFSKKVEAGTVWVNTFMDGFPELPFGGFKQSGLGRELGRLSAEEYTELKTVQLHTGSRNNWL